MPYAFAYCMHLGADEPYLTIDRQKQKVEAYYCRHLGDDFAWGGHFIDIPVSARTPLVDRAAGGAMIDQAKQNDHIVFSSIAVSFYLRRDLLQLLEVARGKRVALHFVDEAVRVVGPDAAKAVSNMLHALGGG